jgi:maleylacetate reductase
VPRPFTYDQPAGRIVFGAGTLGRLSEELDRLAVNRALLVPDAAMATIADTIVVQLGGQCAGVLGDVRQHVPDELVAEARGSATELGADGLVALGGGSATGLAKAIALASGLPIVAVPTTYAGSEMTPVYGITEGGVKRTGRDEVVRPRTVIYDPELSRRLPVAVSAASAMNALAHCVDALWGPDANPVTEAIGREGARALREGLVGVLHCFDDLDARGELLFGAALAGSAFAVAGGALHHKVCHVLGGAFGLPHAETHAAVLPHAAAHNASVALPGQRRLAEALAIDNLPSGLFDIAAESGVPTSLGALGLAESQLTKAAELLLEQAPPNPVPVTPDSVHRLLQGAWAGTRPGTMPALSRASIGDPTPQQRSDHVCQ